MRSETEVEKGKKLNEFSREKLSEKKLRESEGLPNNKINRIKITTAVLLTKLSLSVQVRTSKYLSI